MFLQSPWRVLQPSLLPYFALSPKIPVCVFWGFAVKGEDAVLLNVERGLVCGNGTVKGGRVRRWVCLCEWMCGSVCVRVLGWLLLGVGCLWDLPLSVIEKCDLENVCPAEHESYLHSGGGVLRGGSPGPWQGEPRIGWELTLRATLSLHHMQKNALFNSAKESQIDKKKRSKK